jgi:hypothetical protein
VAPPRAAAATPSGALPLAVAGAGSRRKRASPREEGDDGTSPPGPHVSLAPLSPTSAAVAPSGAGGGRSGVS